jgi:hypothetical protein
MTKWFEDFKAYLPKYLSQEGQEKLFSELEQFPENIDSRIYTTRLRSQSTVFQGDGLPDMWVSNLPDPTVKQARVMVLSNTCDIAPTNKRLIGPRILYCPILSFNKYQGLVGRVSPAEAKNHIDAVRKQHISSLFYLPKNDRLGEEGVAVLDRITNCNAQDVDLTSLEQNRLFTLSDYGFYLLLFKLSIHLTRIREGVIRN